MKTLQLLHEMERISLQRQRVLVQLMRTPDDEQVRLCFRVRHMQVRVLRMQINSMKAH